MMVDHNHGVLGKKKYRPQGACARVAVGQEKIKVGADHHIFIIFPFVENLVKWHHQQPSQLAVQIGVQFFWPEASSPHQNTRLCECTPLKLKTLLLFSCLLTIQ